MAKLFVQAAILLGITFALTGCNTNTAAPSTPSLTTQTPGEDQVWVPEPPANSATFQIASPLHIQPTLDGKVTLKLNIAERNPPGIYAEIHNDSEYAITAGEEFIIEVWDGTNWRTVPWHSEAVFTAIRYGIAPGESYPMTINWQVAAPLQPGLYRVRKSVFRDVDIPITDVDLHDIVGEFVVQDLWE